MVLPCVGTALSLKTILYRTVKEEYFRELKTAFKENYFTALKTTLQN